MNTAIKLIGKCAHIVVVAAILLSVSPCKATPNVTTNPSDNKHLIDSISASLATKTSAADSLPQLLNIFDLSGNNSRLDAAKAAYATAKRAGNVDVQLDMARNITTFLALKKDETQIRSYLEDVRQLPETENRKQTEVYMRSRVVIAHSFHSEAERDAYLRQLIADFNSMDENADEYERAAKLFALVYVLQGTSQGTLLTEYVEKLSELLAAMPQLPTDYLRSALYSNAAMVYNYNDMHHEAFRADSILLDMMQRLTAHYQGVGRPYRNYDLQEYISLRRMLRSYETLTDDDFNTYYTRAMELSERNPDIASDMKFNPSVHAMRLLCDGKYAEALPLVQKLAERDKNINEKRLNLRLLINVADKAGNHTLAVQTKAQYADLLEEFIEYRSAERMRELQILYGVNDLKLNATKSELQRQNARNALYTGAGVVLLLLLIVFVLLYLRFRRLIARIQAANKALEKERATLLTSQHQLIQARDKLRQTELEKSQLITYLGNELVVPLNAITQYTQMIIDAMPDDDDNAYAQRFLAVVRANSRILQEIASDVQEFSLMESHTLAVNPVPMSANDIAEMALDSIRPMSKPEVALKLVPAQTDNDTITTDGRRVVPAITALLTNAIKFTEEGSVTLSVDIDREKGLVTYAVTDTGIGVPADKAQVIFERFSRLNPDRPGIGIGLSNCALIARTLGGNVSLDTSYPGPGARFVLTFPIA